MIERVTLRNFGPLANIDWKKCSTINLIMGNNSCGKTILLKALYSIVRVAEEYQRGKELRSPAEILVDKLFWTYQAEKIGDLVMKKATGQLHCSVKLDKNIISYNFGKDTTKQISTIGNDIEPRKSNSIFLPAKEVLSLHHIILEKREVEKAFGFDDTYYELARALRMATQKGRNYDVFASARHQLSEMLDGKIEFDNSSKQWSFKKGNQKFPIGLTAEGVKKIAILDTLLGNRYLDPGSIIFIDEPESALHPLYVIQLMDIIRMLAGCGIQFFIASHSYFVVKKLFLISQENKLSIPVMSYCDDEWHYENLQQGMPDNPIIDESIRLYEEEVRMVLE